MSEQQLPVRLLVAGRPRTKGHMQVRGRGAQDRPLLQAWMRALGRSIQQQLGVQMRRSGPRDVRRVDAEPYSGPVEVHAFFRFDRLAESERNGAALVCDWPTLIQVGDEDTLRRAVLDALVKSGVIKDDSLSVGGMNYKRWCETGEEAGVLIVVEPARGPHFVRSFEGSAGAL